MKLGMTGSRDGMSQQAKDYLINFIKTYEIQEAHHGDCLGADKQFHDICAMKNIKIIIHPPTDGKMRAFCKSNDILLPKQYLDRNSDIVNDSDILIAFPSSNTEQLRSGTWSTIRYAKKINKELIIVYPDGTTNS